MEKGDVVIYNKERLGVFLGIKLDEEGKPTFKVLDIKSKKINIAYSLTMFAFEQKT